MRTNERTDERRIFSVVFHFFRARAKMQSKLGGILRLQ